jgi:M6 family metalloprotease-like protein
VNDGKVTAVVPLVATSGPLSVVTPGGTASSKTSFAVITPGSPYAASLAKPPFADYTTGVTDPWVGEWGAKHDSYWVHPTGQLHALLVLVDFPDHPATRPVSFYRDLFQNTAGAWFKNASFGRLTLAMTSPDHWVRMSKKAADYGLQNCCPHAAVQAFFKELIAKLNPTIDFSTVDAIYAIGPESTGVDLNILLWRSWPGSGITADGRELRWGVVGNGNFPDEGSAYKIAYFAMTHETGHLWGLADQYGRACPTCDDTHDWVGTWTMMDGADRGVDFLGWDKYLLNWLTPSNVRGLTAKGSR